MFSHDREDLRCPSVLSRQLESAVTFHLLSVMATCLPCCRMTHSLCHVSLAVSSGPLWPEATELACVPSPCSQGGRWRLCPILGVDSGHAAKVWLWVVWGGGDFGQPHAWGYCPYRRDPRGRPARTLREVTVFNQQDPHQLTCGTRVDCQPPACPQRSQPARHGLVCGPYWAPGPETGAVRPASVL